MADRPENVPEQFWNSESGAVNTDALLTAYTDATKPQARPEGLPDQFWDPETNSIKMGDLTKAWSEANAKLNPPEPTAEEKAATEKAASEKAAADRTELAKSYELKAPEGFEIVEEQLTPVRELFAEAGVSKEGAQKLIDLYATNAAALQKQIEAAGEKAWKDLHTEWQGVIEKDPDYGGAKLPETKSAITKVMDAFGTPELRAAFELTGADKNPAVFKFLAKLSGVLTEGKYFEGRPTGGAPKDLAERLYPGGGNKNIGGVPPAGET